MCSRAIWEQSLGFLSWTTEQFLSNQERSLKQQLKLLAASPLGQQMLGQVPIETIGELRERMPLTDYDAYAGTLGERQDEVLPATPSSWLRTSGRSDGSPKWVPLSRAARDQLAWTTLGLLIAARAREQGDVRLDREISILNLTAPPPYFSGTAVAAFADLRPWPARLYPPSDARLEALTVEERMAIAFSGAGRAGVDFALSYSSVLAGVGGTFTGRHPPYTPSADLRSRARLTRARLAAMICRRSLLPRDVWSPKAIIAGGMDAALFRRQIIEQWGCDPLELLGSTEGLFLGMQTWERTTTTLIPHFNFFEFIPEAELTEEGQQSTHVPATLLLDELRLGEVYELVITNLLGGALLRYRTGELLRLTGLSNQDSVIQLPQFRYHGQRSDLIEVGGFARISEQILVRAMNAAGIEPAEWTARKEIEASMPIVCIRVELAHGSVAEDRALGARLNATLRELDPDWRDMEDIADIHPLRLQRLPTGTFDQLAASGVLGTGRCARMNASDTVINMLDVLARDAAARASPQ
ncbi:MAG: GH3 auxin-responsive promoter family protein [Dehalococcoidia bacterium]